MRDWYKHCTCLAGSNLVALSSLRPYLYSAEPMAATYLLGAQIAQGTFGTIYRCSDGSLFQDRILEIVHNSTWGAFVQKYGSSVTIENEAIALSKLTPSEHHQPTLL